MRNFGIITGWRPEPDAKQTGVQGGSAGASVRDTQARAQNLIRFPTKVLSPRRSANSGEATRQLFIRSSSNDRELAAWCFVGALLLGIAACVFSIYELITSVGLLDLVAFD